MTHALNEIEALCKRAARGAGLPWGLAEDAGRAARWLAAAGQDGPGQLAALLAVTDGAPVAGLSPVALGDAIWRGAAGALSPLPTGAALSDTAARLAARLSAAGGRLALDALHMPLLLAPALANAARQTGRTFAASWPGGRFATDGLGLVVEGTAYDTAWADRCTIALSPETLPAAGPRRHRAAPGAEVLAQLTRLAQRTYAPATAESRARGAGAGGSDND